MPAAGHDVDEVCGAEQGTAQAQVGPHPVLHPGDHHEVPLPAGGSRGGHQGHRLPRRCPGDERVARDVLADDVVEEVRGGRPRETVGEPGCGIEESEHGVEVPVGATATGPSRQGRLPPRPREAARAPHRPQDCLDTGSFLERVEGGGKDTVRAPSGTRLGPDAVERERVENRLRQEHVARAATTVLELEAAQSPAQSSQAHGIRTTHR